MTDVTPAEKYERIWRCTDCRLLFRHEADREHRCKPGLSTTQKVKCRCDGARDV